LFDTHLSNDILTSLTACHHLKEFSLQDCFFGADTNDAFKLFFGSLNLTKLAIVPSNARDLTFPIFESITQQSHLEHFEISFHPCPRWSAWVALVEKNVSLKHFILRNGSTLVHYALEKIIPLFPSLETLEGVALSDDLLPVLALNSQKTLKKLVCVTTDLSECKALGLCRNIEVLNLSNSNIKDEDLMHVATCLNGQLTEVYLNKCKNISSDTITALLQRCPKVRQLHLSGESQTTRLLYHYNSCRLCAADRCVVTLT